jgi:sarcosine oxidase subunit gamma
MILKESSKMIDVNGQQSPLVQFWKRMSASLASSNGSVQFREREFPGYLNLRGKPCDGAFVGGARASLGCDLPLTPNTVTSVGNLAVLWLGTDEWLIVTALGDQERVSDSLRKELATESCSVTDVTSGYTTLELSGPYAESTLAKGCSVDLELCEFPLGRCLQTQLAKASVAIWRLDRPVFRLIVRRNFAEYMALWIEDAAQEFGFAAICAAPPLSRAEESEVAVRT